MRVTYVSKLLAIAVLLLSPALVCAESIAYEPFGEVAIYRPADAPLCSVIFVSGVEGWKGESAQMAARISKEARCLVAGLDLPRWEQSLKEEKAFCPSGDFARLALYMQKTLGYKRYIPPILVGRGAGSVLVYAALAQAPYGSLGGIVFDFCPDFPAVGRSCLEHDFRFTRTGDKSGSFLPFAGLQDPFIVLQDTSPAGCSVESISDYLEKIPMARLEPRGRDWMPIFRQSVFELLHRFPAAPSVAGARELPLIEMPSPERDVAVLILSGDGGWVDLARDIADELSSRKFAVIGFDTLQYFWNKQSPETASADLNRIVTAYQTGWKKKKILLVGYSWGADLLPFMVRDLPESTRQAVAGVALIGPSRKTEFEFDVAELERNSEATGALILPAVKKLAPLPVLCLGGLNEHESVCRAIERSQAELPNVKVQMLEGGHMFGRERGELLDLILHHFGL